jgi:hypothetical protein
MSLEDLGNIGEFVAAAAVIVSLIYLAVQIRQNTKSLRASTFQGAIRPSVPTFWPCVLLNCGLMFIRLLSFVGQQFAEEST